MHRWLFISSVLWFSWLGMTLTHEQGHIFAAKLSGGTVQHVVWHPTALSRTDVFPNPRPLFVAWAGPIYGVLAPLVFAAIVSFWRADLGSRIAWALAGFCLLANGAYIGVGAFDPIGDAKEMLRYGSPRWTLAVFGLVSFVIGAWLWHRISPKFGFGRAPEPIDRHAAYATLIVTLAFTAVSLFVGSRR